MASIAFDAATHPGGFATSNPSFSFTIGNISNGLLWFGIFVTGTSTTLNSVTWDSGGTNQAMSIMTAFDANSERLYLAYLANPKNNGTYTLAYTLSGAVVSRPAVASYSGCKQTGIPDASNTNSGNGSSATLSSAVTTIADNCWHAGFGRSTSTNITAGTGTTQRTGTGVSVGWFDNNAAIHPAGSNTIVFNESTSSAEFYTASFAPAVPAANGNFFLFM